MLVERSDGERDRGGIGASNQAISDLSSPMVEEMVLDFPFLENWRVDIRPRSPYGDRALSLSSVLASDCVIVYGIDTHPHNSIIGWIVIVVIHELCGWFYSWKWKLFVSTRFVFMGKLSMAVCVSSTKAHNHTFVQCIEIFDLIT